MTHFRYATQILEEIKEFDPDTQISLGYIKRLAKNGLVRARSVGRCTLIAQEDVFRFFEGETEDNND